MTYNPVTYWTERGKSYEDELRKKGWWDAENPPLLELLARLEFGSVLEVGCGFGRVGAAILSRWPDVQYTGIDVSPDLIAGAQKRLPGVELLCHDLATFDTDRQWDLVVSVSVLGHLRPEDIGRVTQNLRRWAKRDLVTVDWDDVGASTSFQYGHDYRTLYGQAEVIPMGRQSIFWVKP